MGLLQVQGQRGNIRRRASGSGWIALKLFH
jgi:hypothetical protein